MTNDARALSHEYENVLGTIAAEMRKLAAKNDHAGQFLLNTWADHMERAVVAGTIAATPDPRVDEIAACLKAATPGPWVAAPWSTGIIGTLARESRGAHIATVTADADKLFVSHAPEDIAYLLRVARGAAGAAPPREPELWRRLLWIRHGCDGLYGDDGEMQCGRCWIDFKRMSAEEIRERWHRIGLAKLAAEQRGAASGSAAEEPTK